MTEEGTVTRTEQRLCLNVPEAAQLLGISRGLAYQLVRTQKLPVVRFGRRLLVPRAALEKMLENWRLLASEEGEKYEE